MSTSIFMYMSNDASDCNYGGSGNAQSYRVGDAYGDLVIVAPAAGSNNYYWMTEPGYPNTEMIPGATWTVSWTTQTVVGSVIRYIFTLHKITGACTLGTQVAATSTVTVSAPGRVVVNMAPDPAGQIGPFPVDGWDVNSRLRLQVNVRRGLGGLAATHTVDFDYDPEIQHITRLGAVNVLADWRYRGKRGEFELRRSFDPWPQKG